MSADIQPTPGRIVWYWPSANDGVPSLPGQPLAAIVASVHTDRRVNLSVIDSYGNHHARGNVSLIQPDDIRPQPGSFNFAEWMPYQIGQKAKTDELQAQVTPLPVIDPRALFAESDGASASETGLVTDTNNNEPPDGAPSDEPDAK